MVSVKSNTIAIQRADLQEEFKVDRVEQYLNRESRIVPTPRIQSPRLEEKVEGYVIDRQVGHDTRPDRSVRFKIPWIGSSEET